MGRVGKIARIGVERRLRYGTVVRKGREGRMDDGRVLEVCVSVAFARRRRRLRVAIP